MLTFANNLAWLADRGQFLRWVSALQSKWSGGEISILPYLIHLKSHCESVNR